MKILLDTSAYVGFKRNEVETVEIILRAESILVSPVILGELMFGFRNGTRFKENMDDLNKFLEHEAVELVPIGKITSDRYSRIAAQLKKQGNPMPTNDIWIAAHTFETGADLLSYDEHFAEVDGLTWVPLSDLRK